MTMWPRSGRAVPVGTAQVARAAFPNGCLAIPIHDAPEALFEDVKLWGLPCGAGRRSRRRRLPLVLVLQFADWYCSLPSGCRPPGGRCGPRPHRLEVRPRGLELADTGVDGSEVNEFLASTHTP
jgi:hypothetical protein